MKLTIKLTKKHVFLISLLAILLGVGVVGAEWANQRGVGHDWDEIKPCGNEQILKTRNNAWECASDEVSSGGGGGDITAVNAGTGLTGGGTSGDVTLNANTTYLQRRVSGSCNSGSSIRVINSDGTVTCQSTSGGGGGWTNGTGVVYVTTRTDKVGIGTSTPLYYLDVRGSASGNIIVYGENSANTDSSTAIYGISSAIDKTTYGVVGISLSSRGMGVYGEGDSRGVWGKSAGTTGAAGVGVYGQTTDANGWGIFCDTSSGGGKCGGDKSWTVNSDERLKKEIKTIDNSLEKILKLRGVQFYFKGDTRNQDPHLGFIAQEVLPVVPEVISKNPEGYFAMETEELTALLVNAIKEQQSQIEQLKKENEEQKTALWNQHNEIIQLKKAICEINPNNGICGK